MIPKKSAVVHLFLFALIFVLPACQDGIVMEPQTPFAQEEIILPKPSPSPTPEPETPLEHFQYRTQQALDYAGEQKGLIWPVLAVIAVLWGLIQVLRLIVQLTTSTPN